MFVCGCMVKLERYNWAGLNVTAREMAEGKLNKSQSCQFHLIDYKFEYVKLSNFSLLLFSIFFLNIKKPASVKGILKFLR